MRMIVNSVVELENETEAASAVERAGGVPSQPREDATCEACGHMRHVPIARQRGWTLRRCRACGLMFVLPQPTVAQLAGIYTRSAGYFATAETDLSRTSAEPAEQLHRHLAAAGIRGGRFLDVGCATGQLIYHMARLGWQVTGIDVNPDAAAVARAHGLDVAEGALEKQPFADASFDVIHMGDVLEHLPRPRQALLTARRLLRPGGLLVLRMPNADCGFARAALRLSRWLGLPWTWSAAPYHLYEFTPRATSRLLISAGFEVTELRCHGRPSFLYALGASGFLDNLKTQLKRDGRYTFGWRLVTNLPKLIGVALLLLPAFICGVLTDRLRRTGHKMLVVARRPSAEHDPIPMPLNSPDQRRADAHPPRTHDEEAPAECLADILGVTFDLLTYERALARIESWRRRARHRYVTFSNPHSVMMSRREKQLSRAFGQAGMTLPDGAGIIMAASLLGYRHHGRITGPSFMLACCDWGRKHGYRHFFYGGSEGVAEALAARLAVRFPGLRVVGTCTPPFHEPTPEENEALVARINSAKPDIVWVGLGAPKQERWMAAHLGHVEATAMIGVGAAFDFHAGERSWAPRWVRRFGLEWAYRLTSEPRRMWRRNLDSPLFLLAIVGQWLRRLFGLGARRPPTSPQEPRREQQSSLLSNAALNPQKPAGR